MNFVHLALKFATEENGFMLNTSITLFNYNIAKNNYKSMSHNQVGPPAGVLVNLHPRVECLAIPQLRPNKYLYIQCCIIYAVNEYLIIKTSL
jgi:hypothetical protein